MYLRKLWELLDELLHDFTDLKRQLSCGSDHQSADLQETPVKPPQRIQTSVLLSTVTEVYLQNVQKSLVLTCIFFSFSSLFSSSSMIGMTKASVFPLPVTCNDETLRKLEPSINTTFSGPILIFRNQRDNNFHILYLSFSIFCYFILHLHCIYLIH